MFSNRKRLGRKTAWIDFSVFGGASSPQLLFGLATEISDQTEIKQPSAESFLASTRGPLSAFEAHLANITAPTLIAFDEVDYLQHIGEMDAFFRFIRAFHDKQAMSGPHPVSVFVSSFLSPREFIADSFSSPFNIGVQVRLANFERHEGSPLV